MLSTCDGMLWSLRQERPLTAFRNGVGACKLLDKKYEVCDCPAWAAEVMCMRCMRIEIFDLGS